jgi:hypothetical protein
MVDVAGHLGMALIWLAPAWLIIDRRRTAATFSAVGVWFGMMPDVDLLLSGVVPTIEHHGVFHTILAVGILSVVMGPLVGRGLRATIGGSSWFSDAAVDRASGVGVVMVFVAGTAHVFADMLSAPDVAQAVEPFWPLCSRSIGIDLVWYDDPVFDWGLFVVGVGLTVGLYLRRR